MKKLILLTAVFILHTPAFSQVGIGTENPDPSALLDLDVSSLPDDGKKGFLPPRMTAEERMNISSLENGLVVYNTTDDCINFYNGQGWVNICNGTISYPPPFPLSVRLGGSGTDQALYSCIQQTTDGGFIVAGVCYSSASGDVSGVNHGGADYWIVKLDAASNIMWEKILGGSGDDLPYAICQTTDGGYIVSGRSNSSASGNVSESNNGTDDFWIIKLDAYGNMVWDKLLGGSGLDLSYYIQQTSDGGYIAFGSSTSSGTGDVSGVSRGVRDFWFIKLDASGNISWEKLYGGSGTEFGFTAHECRDGSFVMIGSSGSSVSGDVSSATHGSYDFWVVKIDNTGNKIWDKVLGGSGDDRSFYVRQTSDDGYIVAGHSFSSASGDVTGVNHGGVDYWVVKLDSNGNKVWDRLLGGAGDDYGNTVTETADGSFIVVGRSSSSASGDVSGVSHGSEDFWIVKLDASGNIIWEKLFGGAGIDRSYLAIQSYDGSYVIIGESGVGSVGNGDQVNITGKGGTDIWIIRINENGEIIE